MLRRELTDGRQVDFVLMDYVMVSSDLWPWVLDMLMGEYVCVMLDPYERPWGCESDEEGSELHRCHCRYRVFAYSLWCDEEVSYQNAHVIGVTGNALPDDIARFISCGANEVLTKPFTKTKLLTTVDRYLPLISVQPLSVHQSRDVPIDTDLSSSVLSTPTRIKPRPTSPPLSGSAVFVNDTDVDEETAVRGYPQNRRLSKGWTIFGVADSPCKNYVFIQETLGQLNQSRIVAEDWLSWTRSLRYPGC